MIVVSDASPLINFAIIGNLELLPKLFGEVILPQTVFEELTIKGESMAGADEIREADWIRVKSCTNQSLLLALRNQIDPGEAESIVLALELSADLILMDERMAGELPRNFNSPLLARSACLGMPNGTAISRPSSRYWTN